MNHTERLCLDGMQQTWESLAPVAVPRTKFCVAHFDNKEILIIGGKDPDGQRTDSIEVFDCSLNLWRQADFRLRKPRSGFALVQLKNEEKLIIIGGNDGRV